MKMYWHKLTPALVKTLVKIYMKVHDKGENRIHPHNEMDLTTSEHMNMTKLRFHGLIAKCKEDGQVERGYWLITRRGADFLKGELALPRDVQTFRNKVTNHKGDLVKVKDVLGSEPYVQGIDDFEYEIYVPENTDPIETKEKKREYEMVIGEDNIARKVYK